MKISYVLALVLTFVCTAASAQTIRLVDNDPNAPKADHVFATLQEAVEASNAGDIIHVAASAMPYSGRTILTKRLSIYGVGFRLDQSTKSTVGAGQGQTLVLSDDVFGDASGSVISGLHFPAGIVMGEVQSVLKDIVIEDCFFEGGTVTNSSNGSSATVKELQNLTIRNCVFQGGGLRLFLNPRLNQAAPQVSNVLVHNNIFASGSIAVQHGTASGILISNNVFHQNPDFGSHFAGNLVDCVFTDNILYGHGPTPSPNSSIARCTFRNNIVFATTDKDFPAQDNTVENTLNVDPMFVNFPRNGNHLFLPEYDFHLQPDSPALTAATDGGQIGIYGGPVPFDPQGLPPLPFIQTVETPTLVKIGTDLKIRVKVNTQE